MRKRRLTTLFVPLLVAPAFAAGCTATSNGPIMQDGSDAAVCTPGQYTWAMSGGGPGQGDEVLGAAVDKDGNTWVTGTFIGNATWGTFNLTAADTVHTSIFVAKLDPTGKVLLARALQGADPDGGGGLPNIDNKGARIRVDANGDAYVAGTFENRLDVDTVSLLEDDVGGNGAAFVLKLDGSTGTAQWGAVSGNNGGDGEHANDVAVDGNGDVYLTGNYNGQAQFGTIKVNGTTSDQAIFVAKFSASTKQWVWAKGWAGSKDTNDGGIGTAVSVTADGNVYVAGTVSVEASIEGVSLTNDDGSFVAKLGASDGHLVWVTPITSPGNPAHVAATAVDASGAVYVAGAFKGTAEISAASDAGAPVSMTTVSDGMDAFVAKLDPSGTPIWAKHAGGQMPGVARADDVAFDGQSVYISGFKQGDTVFDGMTLSTPSNLFVAKYDPSGKVLWTAGAQTTSSDSTEGSALAVASSTGGIVVGGGFAANVTLGATTLMSNSDGDALVTHMCN